jgi:putative exosortase-associated protein (TIGR04073 family)
MRNAISLLAVVALTALFTSGCAGPEQKLGRGLNNFHEVVRLGEMRRSIEQQAVFEPQGDGYAAGVISGFDRSLGRAGMGLLEVATFPFPPYHPIFTKYYSPEPAFPESYTPRRFSDSLFDTDTYVGFSGGDVMPFVPGSRFSIFDN